jgi:hypothetical protein
VKLSSPYNFMLDQEPRVLGSARIAGNAGIGDGERPYLPGCAGEPGALNDDRREDVAFSIGGGNIAASTRGVLATEVDGVSGPWLRLGLPLNIDGDIMRLISVGCSLVVVTIDSASLVTDCCRFNCGRLREDAGFCEEGVREWW